MSTTPRIYVGNDGKPGPYDPIADQALVITKADLVFLGILGGIAGSSWCISTNLDSALIQRIGQPAALDKLADNLEEAAHIVREAAHKLKM